MVNFVNVLALADLIEKQQHTLREDDSGFNMRYFKHKCGTPSCIAGFAAAMSENVGTLSSWDVDMIYLLAKNWLELDYATAETLFIPKPMEDLPIALSAITPEHAAATLRYLVQTGEVRW